MVKLELGNYLKAVEVIELAKKGPVEVTFLNAGEYKDMKYEDTEKNKSVFHIEIELPNKEQRTWTPNYTTMKAIAKIHGDETEKWVGKKITIHTVRQKVFENMKDVIYVSEETQ